jgi:hypothetical protein
VPRSVSENRVELTGPSHWVDWISLRREPDLLFAGDGRIFRLADYARVPEERYLSAATTLVDLRDMAFEQLRPPPSAMRW